MAIDVDTVATDAHLADHVMGASNLQNIIPDEPDWQDDDGQKTAKRARETALAIVLQALGRRRPPIFDSDLLDVTELRLAVCYRALADLYMGAAVHDDSPNLAKSKRFMSLFSDELNSLQPTVNAGVSASSISVRISRG
jgi:hypothetical protein